jgi:hypothetical protein
MCDIEASVEIEGQSPYKEPTHGLNILAPGGKMVIAGSSYRKDGCLWHAWDSQSPLDRSAWEYVNSLLVRQRITWFPDPIFVIDVCISNDTF